MNESRLPQAIFLMGPTASGKTSLAVELVRHYPLEIISVDSALVYRGLDIGTARPDAETLRAAPHHLVDIRDPAEPYSAAEFRQDALRVMDEIRARGHVPLLVGGTFLYFRALEHGLSDMPAADPAVRAQLENELQQDGLAALHRRLQAIDPGTAARIHATDPQRVLRALEVYEITGQPMSALHASGRGEPLSCDVLKIGLLPTDRAVLHARIEQRLATMLEAGLEAEVRALMGRGDLHAELPALRAVGYRQMWAALAGDEPMDKVGERILVATRQYARRQLTWLRGEPEMNYFEFAAGNLVGRVMRRLDEWLDLTLIKK
ncbi:MAG TPA: tRNA (adenosine(37)-N6)-dimethylallyltransferase MiaA [Gammaproteobacteria bacterium]|nr:tRNA (adenosine(37)-N6)-dimethylallyltransferase MiaA [Gammaproteobacteria bacterium]